MGLGWKNSNKKTGRTPGFYPYTKENIKHAGWCINKGIKIPVSPNWEGPDYEWKIEININGKIHFDPAIYEGDQALKKMYEYYKYYYDKYNK